MTGAQCKEASKAMMKDNWGMGFVAMLIYAGLCSAAAAIGFGIGALLLGASLYIALLNVFILGRKKRKYELKNMLEGWNEGVENRIVLSILKTVYIFLWSLLFVIPGIVKSISYLLAEYIARKHPEKTATECLDESIRIMEGRKWDFFEFQLSFIGWHILGILSFGIAYIWIGPYIMQATIYYIDNNIYMVDKDSKVEENVRFCTNCGNKLTVDDVYCNKCGTKKTN